MSELRPIALHAEEVAAGPATPGMEIRRHLDRDGRRIGWSGWIRNEAGDVSGWHHHAANATYVYVIRGSVAIEFGPGGAEQIEARAGDFFLVPAHTIHRERTGPSTDAEVFIIRVGGEPEKVDVDGPDGADR
jgi:uncharacterized RmlC-like cupin family protein